MNDKLSIRIKRLIKVLNMTQKEFARTVGITPEIVSKYITQDKIPETRIIKKISQSFNVSIDWLLTGEGEMFKSDSASETKNIGMSSEFIEKLKDDLKNKDDSFYASLSMSKDRIFDVLLGKTKFKRIEVIELTRKLNRSLDEYIYLAGYVPEEFTRVLKNPKMLESLRTAGRLTDQEIDQAITAFANVLKKFEKEEAVENSHHKKS